MGRLDNSTAESAVFEGILHGLYLGRSGTSGWGQKEKTSEAETPVGLCIAGAMAL